MSDKLSLTISTGTWSEVVEEDHPLYQILYMLAATRTMEKRDTGTSAIMRMLRIEGARDLLNRYLKDIEIEQEEVLNKLGECDEKVCSNC